MPGGYFRRIDADPAVPRTYAKLLEAIRNYEQAGSFAKATATRLALDDLMTAYGKLGPRTAIEADVIIRRRIKQTQKRPDASGRLSASISSRPLPTTLPMAAVGIASLDALDAGTINPSDRTKTPYWRAQEYGSRARVNHAVYGFFDPGGAAPSQAEFRLHPYFTRVGRKPGVPRMVIRNPIQARHFLETGAVETEEWHRKQRAKINATTFGKLGRVLRVRRGP